MCIEKQQLVPGIQSRKQRTQPSDSDYKVFMQYHSSLTDIPSLVDLTPYFVTANVITKSDGETIANAVTTESQTVALRKLLTKLSITLLLGHDDNKSLNKMLRIMQIYGSDNAQLMADEILETGVRVPLPFQTILSDTGMYMKYISYISIIP